MKNFYDYEREVINHREQIEHSTKLKAKAIKELFRYIGKVLSIKSLTFTHDLYDFIDFTLEMGNGDKFFDQNGDKFFDQHDIFSYLIRMRDIDGQVTEVKEIINGLITFIDDFCENSDNDYVNYFFNKHAKDKYIIRGK